MSWAFFCMKNCRLCDSAATRRFLDMGNHALAGAFLKPDQFKDEKKYPLRLMFCQDCYAVQVEDSIHPNILFKNYFYFSSTSKSAKKHFNEYADDVMKFKPKRVIEFGCNDATLLSCLADRGVEVVGVDPAENVVATIQDGRVKMVCDFFNEKVADTLGKADVIIANNVFAHIDDINAVTRAVKNALTDDGVFIFEVHNLNTMITQLQYDWIYHEHIYYYSLLTLRNHFERHDLYIFDIDYVSMHGGSRRYYVSKRLRNAEFGEDVRLSNFSFYEKFADDVESHKNKLYSMVEHEWFNGHVAGYGASGRANTLIQYCNLDIEYIVDDAPAKNGYCTPGSHIPIFNKIDHDGTDAVVLFAWTYQEEILKKLPINRIIIPLPGDPYIISYPYDISNTSLLG